MDRRAGRHLCSQMVMHSIVAVCSAAQTCTLSVEDLKLDKATCTVDEKSTTYDNTGGDGKLGVGQKCQYECKLGYYYNKNGDPEMQCKINPDKTSPEGKWDPAGCAGA